MKKINLKRISKTILSLLVMLILAGTLTLEVSAASNAPSTIKAGTKSNVLGPYDGLYTYFDIKTYMENGSEKYAYCTDSLEKNAPKGIDLTKSKELDAGYLYIIKNGYPNKSITGNADKDYYITQSAIWWYMDETGRDSGLGSSYKTGTVTSSVKSKELVEGAKKAKAAGYTKPSLSLSSTDITLTKTEDGKYYQSKAIAVTTKAVSSNYKISLNGAPSGTIIVDEKGTEKTSFQPSEKFIIKVPTTKITEVSYKFNATVSATGTVEKVYEYKPGNTSAYQTVVPARTYVETTPLNANVKFSISQTKVQISKQDITTKKELPGATLVIKDSTGKEIASWVSTEEPHYITGLEEGKYTLQETIAPEGYELSTEIIEFEVTAGKVVSQTMYNTPKKTTIVKISKQDITTKKELPGATLVIKDSTGKEIASWVSTEEPHYITGLEEGKYTLQETIAPEGYELSTETIEFEVKSNGEVTSVVMYNKKVTIPEEIEVPITDTMIPPYMYVLGFGIIGAGAYLVVKYSKKENK